MANVFLRSQNTALSKALRDDYQSNPSSSRAPDFPQREIELLQVTVISNQKSIEQLENRISNLEKQNREYKEGISICREAVSATKNTTLTIRWIAIIWSILLFIGGVVSLHALLKDPAYTSILIGATIFFGLVSMTELIILPLTLKAVEQRLDDLEKKM